LAEAPRQANRSLEAAQLRRRIAAPLGDREALQQWWKFLPRTPAVSMALIACIIIVGGAVASAPSHPGLGTFAHRHDLGVPLQHSPVTLAPNFAPKFPPPSGRQLPIDDGALNNVQPRVDVSSQGSEDPGSIVLTGPEATPDPEMEAALTDLDKQAEFDKSARHQP
jgi:hypothetical protein